MRSSTEKVSVSLPAEILRFAERYQKTHHLSSRSEVLVEAIKALRERELACGFDEWANDHESAADPLIDSGVSEGLEPSNEENW